MFFWDLDENHRTQDRVSQSPCQESLGSGSLVVELAEQVLRQPAFKGTYESLSRASDILVDQVKAIDNRRLRKELGALPDPYLGELQRELLLKLSAAR